MNGSRRFSQQREQIYQAVLQSGAHPTAEMVYGLLKPDNPRLSLGTVYRNLHQMVEEGRLTEIAGTTIRFDAVTVPHAHFCCRDCGAVSDVALPYDPELDQLAETGGFMVQGHDLTFYGICPSCLGENIKQPF